MTEIVSLLALLVTIIVTVGATLFGVYKVITAMELRTNEQINNIQKELNEFRLLLNEKNNNMERNVQEQLNQIKVQQAATEKELQNIDRLFEEINAINETIKDIYNKINNLTQQVMRVLEK